MATSVFVPVEDYLRTGYEPDREYVDGELVERHVGEYFHSRLKALIVALLIGLAVGDNMFAGPRWISCLTDT